MPKAHGVCEVLPVGAKWPLSVCLHWALSERSVRLLNVPAGHGIATELPSLHVYPGLQGVGSNVTSFEHSMPGGHKPAQIGLFWFSGESPPSTPGAQAYG